MRVWGAPAPATRWPPPRARGTPASVQTGPATTSSRAPARPAHIPPATWPGPAARPTAPGIVNACEVVHSRTLPPQDHALGLASCPLEPHVLLGARTLPSLDPGTSPAPGTRRDCVLSALLTETLVFVMLLKANVSDVKQRLVCRLPGQTQTPSPSRCLRALQSALTDQGWRLLNEH